MPKGTRQDPSKGSSRPPLHSRRLVGFLRHRPVAKLILAALSLWAAWQIIANTAADNFAAIDPEKALAWSPHHSASLIALADAAAEPSLSDGQDSSAAPDNSSGDQGVMEAPDSDIDASAATAENPADNNADGETTQVIVETEASNGNIDAEKVVLLAGRALRQNPLEADALRLLAVAAQAKGDVSKAKVLMTLAEARSKRDIRVEAWILYQRLVDGDFAGALENTDAMLRGWPEAQQLLLPTLVSMVSDPKGGEALDALLHKNPPWRQWFVTTLPGQIDDPGALRAFFARLQSGGSPVSVEEEKNYLARLIALGAYRDAYASRVDFSAASWVASIGNVNDGGFETPVDGLPFGWVIESVRGAEAQIVSESNANKALRIRFYNAEVPYRHVSQLLLLQPGAYQLSARVRAAALQNERGLEWTIACYGGQKEMLGESERISGTAPWSAFEVPLTVPVDPDCQAQELRLILPARVPSEQKISGEIWYDDFRIVRLAGATTEVQ